MNKNQMILKLKKGEEIVSSVIGFCEQNDIASAWVFGIGAISEATLAQYNLADKSYSKKSFNEPLEIANLSGNIGKLDKKTVAHIHVVLSNKEMNAFGGHLDSAIVSATCELMIWPLEEKIERKFDEEIGLNLIAV